MSYCLLYVDTAIEIDELEKLIDCVYRSMSNPEKFSNLDFYTSKNDNFDNSIILSKREDPTSSKFCIEIYDENPDDMEDSNEFKDMVSRIIIELRKNLEYVVASCNFEDYIYENTGWNWSEENPMHPILKII